MNAQTGKAQRKGGALALHKGQNTAEAGEEQRGVLSGEEQAGVGGDHGFDLLDGQVGGSEEALPPLVEGRPCRSVASSHR